MIKKGNRYPARIMKGSRAVDILTKGGRPIWMAPAVQKAVQKQWLDANVIVESVPTMDTDAYYFDVEVTLPGDFDGNPTDGWTGEMVAGKPPVTLGLFRSEDLLTFSPGGWITTPGSSPQTLGDGRKKWFARYETTPIWWNDVMVDLSVTSDLYGKSVTGLTIYRTAVSLPNYPYALPSQAATLQADLRAAGYTGAVVTTSSASLVATAKWHTQAGAKKLDVTMSGSNVTDVKWLGSTVGSGYPYSMPSQKSALASMLTSALGGDANNKAVVMLHAGEWSIVLPDRIAAGNVRDILLSISPGDPFPTWDMFGSYQGLAAADAIPGICDNVRTPTGAPLSEAMRAFAAVGFIIP